LKVLPSIYLAVLLARWARVDRVELITVPSQVLQRIGLHELKRVVRLRLVVHADDGEPGAVVTHPAPAGSAE
jgi:hypothetical protein